MLKVRTTDSDQTGSVKALQIDYTTDGTEYRYTSRVSYELSPDECD